ncbi:hypothetical protein H8L32_21905 [Undibacterium sp. CY18W]|uniref:Cellulase (Glycosyl hydrolase family 5) n=1 Tax=Undibacterium hunanense TaxID=2762292 RepID=A0ABR6ZW87_9BURK|nr:hypothetical protein [Undibacterium hunanense]MBC3920135.1 hypothetical protein [Undibacterium hunanense]
MKYFQFPVRSPARSPTHSPVNAILLRLLVSLLAWCVVAVSARAGESAWYPFEVNEDALSGVVDFGGMNHALEAGDRLYVKGSHFFRLGHDVKPGTRDDSRVRLFGISLANTANFPEEKDAVKIAQRLRRLGFNAVRLHHLDTILSDSQEQPRGILTTAAFPSFNEAALLRLRVFINALKAEGLYVNLNLHVGYQFRPAVDQVTPMTPGEQMPFASHPLHLFEPRMISLQAEYVQQLLRRLELKDDPALAMIEINNESSLLGAWQRTQLDGLTGEYERQLQQNWQKWVLRQYGSAEQACAVWDSCSLPRKGIINVKSSEASVLEYGEGWFARLQRLASRVMTRLGYATPSALQQQYRPHKKGNGRRVLDYVRYLSDMDMQYLTVMRKTIRQELGDLVPLTGTQMYFGGVAMADAQQHMDYVDEHFYVDHYDFPGKPWDRNDWRIRDESILRDGWQALLQRAYVRDLRKPFVVSEFNQAYPNRQSAEILPVMSAFAAAQDWDGLFLFHYIDGDHWSSVPDSFGLSGHSGQLVTTGIASALFRQYQIRPLPEQVAINLPLEARQLLGAMRDGVSGTGFPGYLQSQYGLEYKHAFFARLGMRHDMQAKSTELSTPGAHYAKAWMEEDTLWTAPGGQLRYNQSGPWLFADTTYARMFAGTRSSLSVNLDVDKTLPMFSEKGRQYGVMLLTSRDALPLKNSRRLLLVLSGATAASQPGVIPQRPKQLVNYDGQKAWWTLEPDATTSNKPSGALDGNAPVWLERIPVKLFHATSSKKITVFPLDGSGARMKALPHTAIRQKNGGFELDFDYPSPWYEIVLE